MLLKQSENNINKYYFAMFINEGFIRINKY